ncbi:MAG: polysaccharide pyruvyl transferase family protein [bacterium]|nr:polysaccharide pyruvyl transferase family protein [bacterium]
MNTSWPFLKYNLKTWKNILSSTSPKMAYVGGWLGYKNLGDEALYAAMVRLFQNRSLIPIQNYGFPWSPPKTHVPIDEAVLAGGTLINGLPGWHSIADKVFPKCSMSFVFGSGVQDPTLWKNVNDWRDTRQEWARTLQQCDYVGLRGPLSAQLMAEYSPQNFDIIGDPVLVFANDYINEPSVAISGKVGLNIGQSSGNQWGSESQMVDEMAALATNLRESGLEVHWYVIWPKDMAITLKAAQKSGTTEYIYEHYTDHLKFINEVRTVSVFVGVKLHAVVLAICGIVPSIMLEYRPKCRDFMLSINQGDLSFRTDAFNGLEISTIVQEMNRDKEVWTSRLKVALAPVLSKQLLKAKELATKKTV